MKDRFNGVLLHVSSLPSEYGIGALDESAFSFVDFLSDAGGNLSGLSVVLDAAEGAAYKIASTVFENSGAKVKAIFSNGDGRKINVGCGALHVENLKKQMIFLK